MDFFVELAAQRKCNSKKAAEAIRKYAIKKNGKEQDKVDENLLPTVETLRRVDGSTPDHTPGPDSSKGAFSLGRIISLLRCNCEGICASQTPYVSVLQDTRLAQEIYKDSETLKFFAVLCLSGCLFAARTLIFSGLKDAGSLPQDIQHEDRHELRVRLFSPFQKYLDKCPHDKSHGENRMMCLARIFSDCIQHRAWLTRIPSVGRSEQLQKYEIGYNMPFIHESEPQQARGNRRFFKFQISPHYCSNHSEDLSSVFLFRKQIQFDHLEDNMRDEAHEESSILSFVNDMKHENIVELLWAYLDTSRADFHYINLIFPWYEYNLKNILEGRIPPDLLSALLPEDPQQSVLGSGLWKAMMGVITATEMIHSPTNKNVPTRGDEELKLIGAHFDIKPANILLDEQRKLILADFGQAQLKWHRIGQLTTLTARPGTPDYAPPPFPPGSRLTQFYDVWSTACVVLEVLTFLVLGGARAVSDFYRDRYNEERGNDRSGAFWIVGADGKPTLRRAVRDRLSELAQRSQRNNDSLKPILGQLHTMLSVDERMRPNMNEVMKGFTNEGEIDFDIFIGRGENEVMKRRLKEMPTSFTTERQTKPLSCDLSLWRDIERGSDNEGMKLVLSGTSAGTYGENAVVRSEMFLPISCFDHDNYFPTNYQSENMLQCKFLIMHRPTTLHFHRAKDLFDFQALVTYQSIHLTKEIPLARAIRLRFTSATLEIHQRMKSHEISLSAGRVFIWRTLRESHYQQKFEKTTDTLQGHAHSSSSSSHGPSPLTSQFHVNRTPTSTTFATKSTYHRNSATSETSSAGKFKMALFTFEPSKRSCIIMDLIPNNYTIYINDPATHIAFKRAYDHNFFPVAMFGWRAGEGGSPTNGIPGIPLSPAVVESEILDGVKLRSLMLQMEDAENRQTLINLCKSIWRTQ